MKPPRGLTTEEAALWRRVTATVTALHPIPAVDSARVDETAASPSPPPPRPGKLPRPAPRRAPPAPVAEDRGKTPPLSQDRGLDSSWDRKLANASIAPDFTLDLHGHNLEQAHVRLDAGLGQAMAMGARLVLLITGKPRPAEAADRGDRRGAIRAKVLDWLAAGPHASGIAAIRKAHRRHGGDGALYIVLKRRR
ncbi:MAG TPA: Smr/MutS family protein [Croceibacterium sp.]|nr:Smr/MutS family protein [Croceibacterium sp.]